MALYPFLKTLFPGKKNRADSSEGPDLFEYAEMNHNESVSFNQSKKTNKESKRHPVLLLITNVTALTAGVIIACFFCGSGSIIDKKVKISMSNGAEYTGSLLTFQSESFSVNDGKTVNLKTSEVRLIEFLTDESKEEAAASAAPPAIRELTFDEKRFLGRYSADISGHKATFIVYATKNGYLGASLKFHSWGTGAVHYMRGVRVSGSTIYFKRQCEADLCRKIGSSHLINQDFTGEISANGAEIKGTYLGGQNASRWSARRF